MTETEATAEIFWTAFRVLPRAEQQIVLRKLLQDNNLRHDLMDLALIEERKDEPSRPLQDYLRQKS
jgi:hypothetical protein